MEINLSGEVIRTVYNALRRRKYVLKYQLEVLAPKGRFAHEENEETIERELAEVEDALQVFEELVEALNV